jgi:hypothetical protein
MYRIFVKQLSALFIGSVTIASLLNGFDLMFSKLLNRKFISYDLKINTISGYICGSYFGVILYNKFIEDIE